jgi:hypothetical protein
MKVIFAPEVEQYLADLIEILFYENYFEFYENANKYVTSLIMDISTFLDRKLKRPAPEYFLKYGENLFYSVFKKSNNTQWYVFFNYEDDIYYIRYIGNNHTISRYFV